MDNIQKHNNFIFLEVSGSHSDEYEVCLLRYDDVYFTTHRKVSEIRRNLLPPPSGRKE
jgi:hypothetical protein